jgi:hypothetical protein
MLSRIILSKSNIFILRKLYLRKLNHGTGEQPAATHATIQTPNPVLQLAIATGIPTPAVTVPNVAPAAA